MSDADLYIFDQPFLGLDVQSRAILHEKLEELKAAGKTIVLVGNKRDIPTCTDRLVEMSKGTIKQVTPYHDYTQEAEDPFAKLNAQDLDLPLESDLQEYGNVVKLTDVNIKSLGEPLLSDINWTIRDHERWLLSGHNGSGKSTLLSMITGDNPQVYTNDVIMFGNKRGNGESVWEIKQKIGFVSPELHLYFMRQTKLTGHHFSMQHSLDCLSVVVSGFNEEIGFSSANSIHQTNMAKQWLEALNLSYLIKKQFAEISLGEQRMLLLVRALIKNPPLLILDEPCQGVDYEYTQRFTHLLDVIAEKLNTTMIYVTHAADEVPSCITHKIELKNGKVKEINSINN